MCNVEDADAPAIVNTRGNPPSSLVSVNKRSHQTCSGQSLNETFPEHFEFQIPSSVVAENPPGAPSHAVLLVEVQIHRPRVVEVQIPRHSSFT